MIDPTLYDARRWRRFRGVRANAFVSPTPELQRKERLLSFTISLTPRYTPENDGLVDDGLNYLDRIGRVLRKRDLIGSGTYRSFFEKGRTVDHFDVSCAWEQTPNPRSRVKLSSKKDRFDQNQVELDWFIDPGDLESMERTLELFGQAVGASGIGRLKIDVKIEDWPAENHHMGTTRMHTDPAKGVVDELCRVHGVQNLYVAGSSVFPTSGANNPTLTIVALALRLSEALKGRLT
jgi:choline dehydrogenase-like flavoprotein